MSHHKAKQLKPNDKPTRQRFHFKGEATVITSGSIWALLRQLQLAGVPLGLGKQADNEHICEFWSCGQNNHGELAHGDTITRTTYTKVGDLSGKHICQISAGNTKINSR